MAISTVTALLNGTTYTLTYNSSTGKYEATITAPSLSSWSQTDHKYGIVATATDNAGNSTSVDRNDVTFGADLQLRVLDVVKPVITVTYPTSGAYVISSLPTFKWTVTDNDAGIDTSTIKITINGTAYTSGITKTVTTGGYSCTFTPSAALPEGSNTVKFDVSDNDGNAAAQATLTFTIDTIPPSLNVSAPADGFITNQTNIDVVGSTDDATSKPITVAIAVNGVDQGSVAVDTTTGSFSKQITLTAANNSVVITATDSAGKTTTITRTVHLDQSAPVFQSITVTPNPVNVGGSFIISIGVTDA